MKADAEILSNETKTNGNKMEHINLSQKTIIDFFHRLSHAIRCSYSKLQLILD